MAKDKDGNEIDDKKVVSVEDFNALKESMAETQKALKGLAGLSQQNMLQTKQTTASLDKLVESMKPKPDDDDVVDDDDIEGFSNKDLISHVVKAVSEVVDSKVKASDKKQDDYASSQRKNALEKEIDEFKVEHKDFMDWGSEIERKLNLHPSLGLEDVYSLVRNDNKDKAKELDEKYAEKEGDDKKVVFGGLTPTSGQTPEDSDKKLNKDEASSKAWEETLEKFPGLGDATAEG